MTAARSASLVLLAACVLALAGCTEHERILTPAACGDASAQVDKVPVPLTSLIASYPDSSWDRRIERDVPLLAYITSAGTVAEVCIPPGMDSPLDSVAAAFLMRSRWTPGQLASHPVSVWWRTSVRFGDCEHGIGEFVNVETYPVRISQPPPEYPQAARDAGIEGTVQVWALIGADGTVWCEKIGNSIPLLDEAALASVVQSLWHPATNNGQPVAVWVDIPIAFRLN